MCRPGGGRLPCIRVRRRAELSLELNPFSSRLEPSAPEPRGAVEGGPRASARDCCRTAPAQARQSLSHTTLRAPIRRFAPIGDCVLQSPTCSLQVQTVCRTALVCRSFQGDFASPFAPLPPPLPPISNANWPLATGRNWRRHTIIGTETAATSSHCNESEPKEKTSGRRDERLWQTIASVHWPTIDVCVRKLFVRVCENVQ